jgi:hypothetical protein
MKKINNEKKKRGRAVTKSPLAPHGGARLGAGRPQKTDKNWIQVTCHLHRDTVEELRQAGGPHFGKFLQEHLDRYPLPNHRFPPDNRKRWVLRTKKDFEQFERAFLRKRKLNDNTRKIEPGKQVANSVR